jgi:hypothetical protein
MSAAAQNPLEPVTKPSLAHDVLEHADCFMVRRRVGVRN